MECDQEVFPEAALPEHAPGVNPLKLEYSVAQRVPASVSGNERYRSGRAGGA
jgi:hypothetical protein